MTVVGSAARPTARASNTDAGGVLLICGERGVDRLAQLGEERGAAGARGILLRRERRLLRCVERRAARVSQQAIRRSGQVHQVKADRRGAVRRQPYLIVGQPFCPALGILERLQKGVGRRHQHRLDPLDRAAEPEFGLERHRGRSYTGFPLRPLQL